MTFKTSNLADFGWSSFFHSQLDTDERLNALAVRVMAVHRNGLHVTSPDLDQMIPRYQADEDDPQTTATVGDWLLLDPDTHRPIHLLARNSLFKRRTAGTRGTLQLIAANIDTLFIMTSCNQDFNIARLERYLVLAHEAEVTPVIIITKADLTETPEDFARQAAKLQPGLLVEMIDARDPDSVACLFAWRAAGQTIALVGSSGVGKSTLVNTLTKTGQIATQDIRDDDAKGRHTTTGRALYPMPNGGWILDTPGMRELQLEDVKAGIENVFSDVVELAATCRFNDCSHQTEPGCAVQAAIAAGTLDTARLARWQKLVAEETYNTTSTAQRHTRDRAFGKMVKSAVKHKKKRDGR